MGEVSGRVIAPTIVADVPRSCALAQEEVFGPVFTVGSYTDVDAAFDEANSTRFALQASIFTTDLRLALDATDKLEFGGVLVNEAPTFRTDGMPYGGGRDSGNTREGPASTVRELVEERLVIIDQAATRPRSSAVCRPRDGRHEGRRVLHARPRRTGGSRTAGTHLETAMRSSR